jgi:hemoglobin-like flavoprotein
VPVTVYSDLRLPPKERLKRTSEFLGLSERDLQLIRQTSGIIREHAGELVSQLYDRLAAFPESAELLANASAATGEGLDRRREALANWLGNIVKLAEEGSDWLPEALYSTGATHTGLSKSKVRVPLDLMVLSTALLQNAIVAEVLRQRPGDMEAAGAWTRITWLALDLMAAAYDELPAHTART